jgi:phosphate transport system substrate-binding protein
MILLFILYALLIALLVILNKKGKPHLKVVLSLLGLSICIFGADWGYRSYVNHIPTVKEYRWADSRYEPFREGNHLALSREAPALHLEGDLPRLDGATALYPLYAAFVQASYPEGAYRVYDGESLLHCSGTAAAYKKLLEGRADIIFCAAPSKEQAEAAAEAGNQFFLTPIGREAFVFFVNRRNPVNAATIEQIKEIYSGNIKNWKMLGGKNKSIRAFQRPPDSGSQTALESIMAGKPLMKPIKGNVPADMGGIISEVSAYRNYYNAIGYSFLYYTTQMVRSDDIKLLSINGTAPSRETIQNGTYPFTNDFYAITLGDETENARAFIQWIQSEQGQELVEKTGYTPLSAGLR